jgi:hypothetical protein
MTVLINIRLKPELKKEFKLSCCQISSTMTAELTNFIKWYVKNAQINNSPLHALPVNAPSSTAFSDCNAKQRVWQNQY